MAWQNFRLIYSASNFSRIANKKKKITHKFLVTNELHTVHLLAHFAIKETKGKEELENTDMHISPGSLLLFQRMQVCGLSVCLFCSCCCFFEGEARVEGVCKQARPCTVPSNHVQVTSGCRCLTVLTLVHSICVHLN